MRIAVESALLAALCLFDLVSTVWLILAGVAAEANPLLDFYIQNGGLVAFAAAKVLLSLGPLFALEVLRRRRPRLVQSVLRVGIALYLIIYFVGGLATNAPVQAGTLPAGSMTIAAR